MTDNKVMERIDILDAIYVLGQENGYYNRLYVWMNDAAVKVPDWYDKMMNHLEAQKFTSVAEVKAYLEAH